MLAVVRVDVIIWFQASTETDNSGFLTKIKMAIATYASPVVHLTSFFLKVTDKHHFIIVVEQGIPVFTLWQRGRSLLTQGGSITCIRLLLSIHIYYDPFLLTSLENAKYNQFVMTRGAPVQWKQRLPPPRSVGSYPAVPRYASLHHIRCTPSAQRLL